MERRTRYPGAGGCGHGSLGRCPRGPGSGQRAVHHRRPVARRLPVGPRPPAGARRPTLDRLAAARHPVRQPLGPGGAVRTEPGLPLHGHLLVRPTASVRNGTPLDDRFTNVALEARAAGYDPVLFGYTDASVDPRTVRRRRSPPAQLRGGAAGLRAGGRLPLRAAARRGSTGWSTRASSGPTSGRTTSSPPIHGWPGRRRPRVDLGAAGVPGRAQRDRLPHRRPARLAGATGTPATPWFAHLSYLRPHPPYRVPAPYHDRYDPADVPAPVRARHARARGPSHPLAGMAAPRSRACAAPDDDELRQITATYYGMMAEVDHHLGRVLDWLDETGAADDTLVVLTSDHGDQMGDHWLMEKLGWWDESYHVPMIVRDPRAPPTARGRRVDGLHRARRRDADGARVAGARRARPVRRPLDGAVRRRGRTRWTAGAPRPTGSGTSAIRPATRPRTRSA